MTKKTNYKNLARHQAKLHAGRQQKRRRKRISGWSVAIFGFIAMLVIFVTLLPDSENSREMSDADQSPAPVECVHPEAPPRVAPYPMCISPRADYRAVISTSYGPITVQLLPKAAPVTVNNFASLAESGYYDDTLVHRVSNSLSVIQAGDHDCTFGSAACGSGGPGYAIEDELEGKEDYVEGTVAMANSGPDTGGSQFFIVTGNKARTLPGDYTIFGRVIDGLSVAQEIQRTPVQGESPKEAVTIKSVKVTPPIKDHGLPTDASPSPAALT